MKTATDEELLYKFYDATVKEEVDEKKIKEEHIFPKIASVQRIKKFTTPKDVVTKELLII